MDKDGFILVSGKKQVKKVQLPTTKKSLPKKSPSSLPQGPQGPPGPPVSLKEQPTIVKQLNNNLSTEITTLVKQPVNDGYKRILCHNMFTFGICPYNNGCVYAHSLEEQRIDPMRKKVMNIIIPSNSLPNNLEDLNLIYDKDLYNAFQQLTRLCYGCQNNKCLGGYNCKNGASELKYVVCYNDLTFGQCTNNDCKKCHLTKRGLKPYKLQNMIYNGYSEKNKTDYVTTLVNNVVNTNPPIELTQETIQQYCPNNISDDDDSIYSLSESDVEEVDDDYILTLIP